MLFENLNKYTRRLSEAISIENYVKYYLTSTMIETGNIAIKRTRGIKDTDYLKSKIGSHH